MRRTIPRTFGMSGAQAPLDAGAVENSARYFLDRDFGGVEHRNAMPFEQGLGRSDLESHLRRRRIAAVGTPLVSDLLQPIRLDRQTEQFARMRVERRRQIARLEVVLGQREICGKYPVLHR